MLYFHSKWILPLAAVTFFVSVAGAFPISIGNPGFDDPGSGAAQAGFEAAQAGDVLAWRNAGKVAAGGISTQPDAPSTPNAANAAPGDAGAFQLTNYVIQVGDVFTLTYYAKSGTEKARASARLIKTKLPFTGGMAPVPGGAVNARQDDPFSATVPIASSNPTLTDAWGQYTLTYTATKDDEGKILGVAFDGAGDAAASYDTFALDVTHKFIHPGVSHSQADLDRMKSNVKVEPYKSAFAAFVNHHHTSSDNKGQGPAEKGEAFVIRNDASVAYSNALMWYMTGSIAHRDNAIAIMNGWANTMRKFDPYDHISAATAVTAFCNAGELIRLTSGGEAWPTEDIAKFQNWMIDYLGPALLTPGNAFKGVNHVGTNGELEWSGHGVMQMHALLYLGIFCDRSDLYSFALTCYRRDANKSVGLREYINTRGTPFNVETSRDGGHPSGALGTFTQIAYAAQNQGVDLFSLGNNLLARAYELQARVNMSYEVPIEKYQANYGDWHSSISAENRNPRDNLSPVLNYRVYHDTRGLELPYTWLSASLRGVDWIQGNYPPGSSEPIPAFIGEPAPKDVVLFSDGGFAGNYIVHCGPGSYTAAQLNARGAHGGAWDGGVLTVSSIKVPTGWTVQAFDSDHFTGTSVTMTGSFNTGDIGWNDRIVSIKVTAGTASDYVVSNGTYQIVNRGGGKVLQVTDASKDDGELIEQGTYKGAVHQLWRVESIGNGQYLIQNLNGNKAMQVAGRSTADGSALVAQTGNVDQATYVPSPNLGVGGTASASTELTGSGEGAARAFDGEPGSKWSATDQGGAGWLQCKLPAAKVVDQYRIVSANDVPGRDPKAWRFQGSADGNKWVALDTQKDQVFENRFQTKIYPFANKTAYAYYRLSITANAGGAGDNLQIGDLGLYSSQTGGIHQRWSITAIPKSAYGSYFKILNVKSGKALDVANVAKENGNVIQRASVGGPSQQWSFKVP